MARMKAVISRSIKTTEKVEKENKIQLEDLIIDFDGRTVCLKNEIIALTPKEYDLLSFFVQNQNKVFSREQLLTSVWGVGYKFETRAES